MGPIKRVPAEEIEALVAAQVRGLCCPDRLGRELARLEVAQEQLVATLDASGAGTWRWDLHANKVDWDPALVRLRAFLWLLSSAATKWANKLS